MIIELTLNEGKNINSSFVFWTSKWTPRICDTGLSQSPRRLKGWGEEGSGPSVFCLWGKYSCPWGHGCVYSDPARQVGFSMVRRYGKALLLWTLWPLPSLPLACPPVPLALRPFILSFFLSFYSFPLIPLPLVRRHLWASPLGQVLCPHRGNVPV